MAATAAAFSCLLQLILVNGTVATSANQQHERQLQVLSEVVSGPARERPLTLHLDTALPADVRRAIVGLDAVRRTPHITLSLGFNHSWRRSGQEAATALFRGSFASMLHVVLWITPRPELLQTLWLNWKPRNLLLFSLGSSTGADVLRDEALSGVEKLALIGHLSDEADRDANTLGVYTMLPFSSGGEQLLGPWEHEFFGSWEALFPDRFRSFEGYAFQLATWMIDYPYIYRKNASSPQGTGISIKVLETLSSFLNFSYTLTVEPTEPVYGGKVNGSWAGILGMIHKRQKNFTVNTFYLTPERFKDFDPSSYWAFTNFRAFLLKPEPLPMSMNLLRPFTFGVWATVASSFAVAVCSYLMLERTSGICGSSRYWETSVWLQLHRALVGQGAPTLPRAAWQRVFLAMWFLCCLVVTAAYTCNLVGIFTRPNYPQRIHTLQELAHSDFRLAKHDVGGIGTTVIRKPPNSLYRKGDLFPRKQDVLEAMLAGTHALFDVTEVARLLLASHHESSSWYTVREPLLSGSIHCYFRRHTPWKHTFDASFQRLVETGLFQQWYKEEMAKLGDGGSDDSRDSNSQRGSREDSLTPPLNLQHLQGVFYILSLAGVASGVILLLELLTYRYEESRVGYY